LLRFDLAASEDERGDGNQPRHEGNANGHQGYAHPERVSMPTAHSAGEGPRAAHETPTPDRPPHPAPQMQTARNPM